MQRVRQFLSALTAKVTVQDEAFARSYLSLAEYDLFNQMSLPDRQHCLKVAYTLQHMASGLEGVDMALLTKAALLHDVGRRRGDVSTFDKTIAVLARKLLGRGRIASWAKYGRGSSLQNLRHALYVSLHHPEIGAELLRSCGTEAAVVELVRHHHDLFVAGRSQALELLQKADDLC